MDFNTLNNTSQSVRQLLLVKYFLNKGIDIVPKYIYLSLYKDCKTLNLAGHALLDMGDIPSESVRIASNMSSTQIRALSNHLTNKYESLKRN